MVWVGAADRRPLIFSSSRVHRGAEADWKKGGHAIPVVGGRRLVRGFKDPPHRQKTLRSLRSRASAPRADPPGVFFRSYISGCGFEIIFTPRRSKAAVPRGRSQILAPRAALLDLRLTRSHHRRSHRPSHRPSHRGGVHLASHRPLSFTNLGPICRESIDLIPEYKTKERRQGEARVFTRFRPRIPLKYQLTMDAGRGGSGNKENYEGAGGRGRRWAADASPALRACVVAGNKES
jgi:hypothetical protein